MIRMTVTLDENVLDEAKQLLHTHTKRKTIEIASKEIMKQK
jgi:Arc/MetJ family transcription regulator